MLQASTTTRRKRFTPRLNRLLRRDAWRLLICGWVVAGAACAPAEPLPTASFAAPAGLALGGLEFDRLFVANTGQDAVQVVQMARRLEQVDSVIAPARYFPLSIPVGPSPSELAASADGRYIFALDSINNRLELIDAVDLKRVRQPEGSLVSLPLGGPGSEPSGMLGAQTACSPSEQAPSSDCLGRVYVALRALGVISVVDIRQSHADNRLSLVVDRQYVVGGAPLRMAADAREAALFITDAAAPELIRLPLAPAAASSAPERYALGAVGGPLTVSADSTFVIVGRPTLQDLIVYASDANTVSVGTLHVQPADPVCTPTPACLHLCNQPEPLACLGAHEADRGLCVADGRLAVDASQPYVGLYLGGVPAHMAALAADAQSRLITATCEGPAQTRQQQSYAQVIAVAQLDGTLRLVGLRDSQGKLLFELLDAGFCQKPSLSRFANQSQPLDSILSACAQLPQTPRRLACAGESSPTTPDAAGLVTVLRGQAAGQSWGLTWEGSVVGGQSSYGGASLDANGHLLIAATALQGVDIVGQRAARFGQAARGGDIIEMLSAPQLRDTTCAQALASNTSACHFERRIVAVVTDPVANISTIVLDRPLVQSCFTSNLSFRILAGDAFTVSPVDQSGMAKAGVARLYPGDTFGPGSAADVSLALSFTIRSDLDAASDADACTRYDPSQPGPHASGALRRGQLLAFSIVEPFLPQPIAERLDALSRPVGPSGSLVQGIVATRSAARPDSQKDGFDYLCVSFGGSNGVLVLDPYNAPTAENRDTTSRLLQ